MQKYAMVNSMGVIERFGQGFSSPEGSIPIPEHADLEVFVRDNLWIKGDWHPRGHIAPPDTSFADGIWSFDIPDGLNVRVSDAETNLILWEGLGGFSLTDPGEYLVEVFSDPLLPWTGRFAC